MGNNFNVEIGGKLGDFIYGLIIPKILFDFTGRASNVFISNKGDAFECGLENTYSDLKDIVLNQRYVNEFHVYDMSINLDYELSKFRSSELIYKACWTKLYLDTYFPNLDNNYGKNLKWIETDSDSKFENTIFINRSSKTFRHNSNFLKIYEHIINNNIVEFISFNKQQYEIFPYKHLINFNESGTLTDMFIKINSCKLFVGNYSGPLSFASSVNKSRIAEVPYGCDGIFYKGDEVYYDSISWIENDSVRHISDQHLDFIK